MYASIYLTSLGYLTLPPPGTNPATPWYKPSALSLLYLIDTAGYPVYTGVGSSGYLAMLHTYHVVPYPTLT